MNILGWLFVITLMQAAAGFLVVGAVKWMLYIFNEMRLNRAHRESLSIRPERGQIWRQDGEEENEIYVHDIGEDGTVVLSTVYPYYSATKAKCWKDTPERWKERMMNRRLVQVRA